MKTYIFILLLVLLNFLNSCDEGFEPYTDYDEKYVMHCILRGDTNYQTLILTKSYFTNEPNPINYKIDPSVENATIRVWYGDSIRFFTQTTGTRKDSSRYGSSVIFYENNDFTPPVDKELEIQIILSNGRKLSSITYSPSKLIFNRWNSDTIIPSTDDDKITLKWTNVKNSIYVKSRFTIVYSKYENGSWQKHIKEVPQYYVEKNGIYYPKYSDPNIYGSVMQIDMETFSRAMSEISEGDPNKENYIIYSCIAEVIAYDENLSKYYSAQKNSLNNYTINLNRSNFTNINGGTGIFCSYSVGYYFIRLRHSYINSFGYIPGISDVKPK
ncbi:MAG: hypothetical protein JXA68_02540 [Ignavibacteriales bacterium]|nr:hypothetical protein [Ignavibacteriales bacterium]